MRTIKVEGASQADTETQLVEPQPDQESLEEEKSDSDETTSEPKHPEKEQVIYCHIYDANVVDLSQRIRRRATGARNLTHYEHFLRGPFTFSVIHDESNVEVYNIQFPLFRSKISITKKGLKELQRYSKKKGVWTLRLEFFSNFKGDFTVRVEHPRIQSFTVKARTVKWHTAKWPTVKAKQLIN